MKKRILPIIFSVSFAIFGFIAIQQVLAEFQLTNNGATVDEGLSVIIANTTLSVTDTMSPTASFTYTILDAPDNGNLRKNATILNLSDTFTQGDIDANQINYLHDGSETTTDSFQFNISNGITIVLTSTFNITINPVNDRPTPVVDGITIDEGGSATLLTIPLNATSVLSNDLDAENDTLTATILTSPTHASTFTFNLDGTFNYVHDGSENPTDQFSYIACDNGTPTPKCNATNGTVNITINPINDSPIAAADTSMPVNEGATVSLLVGGNDSVLDNDTDADDVTLTASIVTSPTHDSSFTFNSDGTFSYTHDGSENHTDSFTYTACDDESPAPACDTATVTLDIQAVNDPPVANNDTAVSFNEGATVSTLTTGSSVLNNDSDNDDVTLTASIVTSPTHDTAFSFNSDGTFSYTHDGSENHSDSFTYEACDDESPTPACDTATVNFTATNTNDTPNAVNDIASAVNEGGTVNTLTTGNSVFNNDSDDDVDDTQATWTATIVTSPTLASTFTFNTNNGQFSYTHNGSENFTDSFVYEMCDDETPTPACDTATVNITITPVNDVPIANNDTAVSFNEGTTVSTLTTGSTVLNNDSDDDDVTLTATIVTSPTHYAGFTFNTNGTFSYTHDGSENHSDSFTYKACDDQTPIPACDTATVTLIATNTNDTPVAVNDTASAVNEGGTVTTLTTGNSVLNNDSDDDLDDTQATWTASIITQPSHDSLFTFNANGTFSYTHDGSENFTDSFVYRMCDNETPTPACDTATVNITITPVNDTPNAVNDTASAVNEGGTVTTLTTGNSVLNNDSDDDLDDTQATWTASIITQPSHDSLFTFNANGTFSYTHDGSENFTDSFVYRMCDNETPTPACDNATVSISITPVNDTPVAVNDTAVPVSEGETVTTLIAGVTTYNSVLDNDSDDDLDDTQATWTATIETPPAHASAFVLNPNGTFSYTHDGTANFSDSFEYKICDNETPTPACDIGLVNITISTVNDPPTAVPDTYYLFEGASISENVTDNDYDEEGDAFTTITPSISPPSHAVAFNLANNGAFTYEHSGTENFTDSFVYRVCKLPSSPISDCTETSVSLVITPTNDAPTTAPDLFYVPRSTTFTSTLEIGVTSVISNDTDAEGNNLIVTTTPVVAPNQADSFTLFADGTFVYAHDDSSNDPDSFTYEVCDDDPVNPQCSTGIVTINISQRPTTFIYLPTVLKNYSPDEPNNEPCTAYPIGLNSQYNFNPNDQEDWYRITLPSQTNLTISVQDYTLVGDLIVYQSADCVINGSDPVKNDGTGKPTKVVNWVNAPAGTYFIRVFTTNSSESAPAYKLLVSTN